MAKMLDLTGVLGGVVRLGDSWIITWGAIPLNDKGFRGN